MTKNATKKNKPKDNKPPKGHGVSEGIPPGGKGKKAARKATGK